MKPVRQLITFAAIGAIGAATWGVGTSLVKDVQFARAEAAVNDARAALSTSNDMSNVYKQVNHAMENSVVHITVSKTVAARPRINIPDLFRGQPDDGGDDNAPPEPFRRRGPRVQPQDPNDDAVPDELKESATGSGVIMDVASGEGFIVTNNHVVADANDVTVTLADGRRIKNATVVGTDPKTDVAVIKITADRLIAAKWGDSDTLEKGDVIVAFGSPLGFVGSMSHGIVSALNRDHVNILRSGSAGNFAYENFIQVDAAINPGNSGGPLVNTRGEVVGINTAIASTTGSFAGIGFAIPSNQAKLVYESLKASGKVVRGYLGVGISEINSEDPRIQPMLEQAKFKGENGIVVFQVQSGSPALNILRPGDIITELNGQKLKNLTEFRNKVAAMAPGTKVQLKVWRDEKDQTVEITLGTQPEGPLAAAGKSNSAPAAPQQMVSLGLTLVTPTSDDLTAAGLPGDAQGALIKQVRPNSIAARMGLRPGDLIIRIGSTAVKSADDAKNALAKVDANKGSSVEVLDQEGQRLAFIPKRAK